MRWSPKGADRVAVTRAAVFDGRLTIANSKRAAYPRKADSAPSDQLVETSIRDEEAVNASVEVSASATISAEGSVGFGTVTAAATAGIAVTAGYAREWNESEASSSQFTVAVQCDKFEDGGTKADIYALTLLTQSETLNAGTTFKAVSKYYACC